MNKAKRKACNRSIKRLITRYSKMKRMQDSLNVTETYSEVVEHARYQRWSRTYDSRLRIEQLRRERNKRRRRSQRNQQEPPPATWDSTPLF